MRRATVHVPDAALADHGVAELVSRCRDAGLRDLDELDCGPPCLLVVTVAEPVDDALDGLDAVDRWRRLTAGDGGEDDGVVYLVTLSAAALPDDGADVADTDVRVDETGLDVSLVGRQGDVADVADALDLDASTVTEHLQRAERNLLAALFGRTD